MRKRKRFRGWRIRALFLLIAITASTALSMVSVGQSADENMVTVTVEKFTLGQGYLIEPCLVELKEGDNAALVLDRVLRNRGFDYSSSGSMTGGFYLQSIRNADSGILNIPACIRKMAPTENNDGTWVYPPTNTSNTGNKEFPALGEFAYSSQSGWMYCVNGSFPNVGFDGTSLKGGDVMRVQFTVYGLGADIGEQYMGEGAIPAIEVADKDALTARIAGINENKEQWFAIDGCQAAYQQAMQVLQKLNSSQSEVDAALAALPEEALISPTKLVILPEQAEMAVGDESLILTAKFEPENANQRELVWTSSKPEVAKVDEDGRVTPVSAGETDITATTANGIWAVCHVTVKSRPITEIILSCTELTLERGGSRILSVSYQPENTTEEKKVSFSSSKADVASVDDSGRIVGISEGSAVITAKTAGGITAQCTVRVVSAEGMAKQLEAEIEKLPSPQDMRLSDCTRVTKLWERYEEASEAAREKISEKAREKLEQCREEIEKLLEEKKKADHVAEMIAALPAVSEATLKEEDAVKEAQEAYEALSSREKDMVSAESVRKLQDVKEQLQMEREEAYQVSEQILKLPASKAVSLDDYFVIVTANKGYVALDAQQKALVTNASILEETVTAFKNLIIHKATALAEQEGNLTLESPAVAAFLPARETYEKVLKLDADFFTYLEKRVIDTAIGRIPVPLTGITLPLKEKVDKGKTLQLTLTPVPENTTESTQVSWKSSDTLVATVDSNGLVKGVKDGQAVITATSVVHPELKAYCIVTVMTEANKLETPVSQVIAETKSYMLGLDTNPGKGSEWFVLGLARSGMDLNDSYFQTYYKNIAQYIVDKKGALTQVKYTEYSKLILALTAIGKDARNVSGYNLLSYLADFENVTIQGFNGPIWALLALNSNPDYAIPEVAGVKKQTTEQVLVDYLVDHEINGGGWALTGKEPDADITAMTIQALAPYYHKEGYEKVTAAINRGLDVLGNLQVASTGGYQTMGANNSESCAQVIVALCSVGIDPASDPRFVKTGNWTVENLISYHISGSGFMHVKKGEANNGGAEAGSVNGMATEQAFYALVAYQRLLDGKTALYDMSDLTVKKGGTVEPGGNTENNSKKNSAENKTKKEKTQTQEAKKPPSENTGNSTEKGNTSSQSVQAGTVKKTSGTEKKETETKEETQTELSGWSFEGEDYIPKLETEGSKTLTAGTGGGGWQTVALVILSFLAGCGLRSIASGILAWKRGRK